MPTPVIIDTDPGIDDAIALTLAAASPELTLLGVTTVGGNTGLETTTSNALRILHLLGRDDVPVAAGAARALVHDQPLADTAIHGPGGLGGVELALPGRQADPRGALALMVELIESSPEPVTLLAIGPLTNVALLAAARPDVYARLERLVIMGGGVHLTGNRSPAAEFNIWFDPEAAARVFAAGVPVTMVGLDVTQKALFAPSDWDRLRGPGAGPVAQAVTGMIDFYGSFYRSFLGTDATAQHDALAVTALVKPELVTTEHVWVGVETSGMYTRGMTVADLRGVWKRQPNTHVALDVDAPGYIDFLVSRIAVFDCRGLRGGAARAGLGQSSTE
ncbi:MAG: nucleoside hydrolase [Actinomycetia bacterium]|nr:nucleoside hydrolase [Actinomycetes bacterium]